MISADGLVIAFSSLATNLAGGTDTNGRADVFVRDSHPGAAQAIARLSGSSGGLRPVMSASGRRIAFESNGLTLYDRGTNTSTTFFSTSQTPSGTVPATGPL